MAQHAGEGEIVALINRLMAQARRRERRYAFVAGFSALVAVGASVGGWMAYDAARNAALQDSELYANYEHALETMDALSVGLAGALGTLRGADDRELAAVLAGADDRLRSFVDVTEPRDPQHLARHAELMVRFATAFLDLGERARAVAAARTARDTLDGLSTAALDRHDGHSTLARALMAEGDALADLGRHGEALAAYRQASAMGETLLEGADEAEGDVATRRLVMAYEREAQALFATGDPDGAAARLAEVIEARETLVAAAPDDTARRSELVVAYSNLADQNADGGRHEDAITLYQNAISTLDAMLKREPDNSGWRELRARHLARAGRAAMAAGARDTALAHLDEAREIYFELRADTRGDPVLSGRLAEVMDIAGAAYTEAGDMPAARANLMESLEIRRHLAERPDASTASRKAFARTMMALAAVDRRENIEASARVLMAEALDMLRETAAAEPESVDTAVALAQGLNHAASYGFTDQEGLREALRILQRLDDGDRLSAEDRTLMAEIRQSLGEVSQ